MLAIRGYRRHASALEDRQRHGICPALIGRDPTAVTAARLAMNRVVIGNPYVKCAIDIALDDAWGKSATVIESGPAAGMVGAAQMPGGDGDVIPFDVGGTTAKASLIEGGRLVATDQYEVGGGISLSSALAKGGGYALKRPVIAHAPAVMAG